MCASNSSRRLAIKQATTPVPHLAHEQGCCSCCPRSVPRCPRVCHQAPQVQQQRGGQGGEQLRGAPRHRQLSEPRVALAWGCMDRRRGRGKKRKSGALKASRNAGRGDGCEQAGKGGACHTQ